MRKALMAALVVALASAPAIAGSPILCDFESGATDYVVHPGDVEVSFPGNAHFQVETTAGFESWEGQGGPNNVHAAFVCPINGPAIHEHGDRIGVANYTRTREMRKKGYPWILSSLVWFGPDGYLGQDRVDVVIGLKEQLLQADVEDGMVRVMPTHRMTVKPGAQGWVNAYHLNPQRDHQFVHFTAHGDKTFVALKDKVANRFIGIYAHTYSDKDAGEGPNWVPHEFKGDQDFNVIDMFVEGDFLFLITCEGEDCDKSFLVLDLNTGEYMVQKMG